MGSSTKLPNPKIPIKRTWAQKNYPDGSLGDIAIITYPYHWIIDYKHFPPLPTIIIKPFKK